MFYLSSKALKIMIFCIITFAVSFFVLNILLKNITFFLNYDEGLNYLTNVQHVATMDSDITLMSTYKDTLSQKLSILFTCLAHTIGFVGVIVYCFAMPRWKMNKHSTFSSFSKFLLSQVMKVSMLYFNFQLIISIFTTLIPLYVTLYMQFSISEATIANTIASLLYNSQALFKVCSHLILQV